VGCGHALEWHHMTTHIINGVPNLLFATCGVGTCSPGWCECHDVVWNVGHEAFHVVWLSPFSVHALPMSALHGVLRPRGASTDTFPKVGTVRVVVVDVCVDRGPITIDQAPMHIHIYRI